MSAEVSAIRTELPDVDIAKLRAELELSREKLARVFDVSAKTIERWEARHSLPSTTANRQLAGDLREIIDLAIVVYGADGMRRFLGLPLPGHEGATPLQLIERRQSGTVFAALSADYEGMGS